MKVVSGLEVYKAYLSDARKSVDALIEFARAKSDTSSPLLQLVVEAVNKEFANLEMNVKDALNKVIASYNSREAIIAKVNPAEKPQRDKDGSLMTGYGLTEEIRQFGIKRVPDTKAWMLVLNDESVAGTGMDEETAIRIYRAVDAWRNIKREAEKESEQ